MKYKVVAKDAAGKWHTLCMCDEWSLAGSVWGRERASGTWTAVRRTVTTQRERDDRRAKADITAYRAVMGQIVGVF